MSKPKYKVGTSTKYANVRTMRAPPLNPKQRKQVRKMITADEEIKDSVQGFQITNVDIGGINLGDGSAMSTTGQGATKNSLTQTGQGNTSNTRVGEEIELVGYTFKYTMISAVAGLLTNGDRFNNMRIVLFRWYVDSNFEVPTLADVLDNTVVNWCLAPYNRTNKEKYHIMYDKTHHLENDEVYNGSALQYVTGSGSVYTTPNPVNIYGKKLGRKKCEYGTGINFGYGHIYGFVVSDSAFAISTHPQCEFIGQVTYRDA